MTDRRQPEPKQHDESGKWSTLTWVLIVIGGGIAFLFCAGCLASIAIPSFMNYLQRSKTAEAESVMKKTSARVKSHYQNNGELPGLGRTLKTVDQPPTGGNKYQPQLSNLTTSEKQLWDTVGWPTGGDSMYFQYTYRAEETEDGARAVIRAKADFTEGGEVHTVTQKIKVRDGQLVSEAPYTMNEFE